MASFPLLELPLELRDHIYECIMLSDMLPAVLILSHQVRQETIRLLHRKATYSGLFTYDRIKHPKAAPEGHCRRFRITLPDENSDPCRGQDFDAFYCQNEHFLAQDYFMVTVEYGKIARGLLVPVSLDRIGECEYWWSLVRRVVRNGRSCPVIVDGRQYV
ncbi:hypothetical protein IMSHALPRED_004966 [Imshaugia aleurites]|uniref:F-box domain-containing protein n=1 Tax=Imshaugia aleurites TaxID=172621 RepID=A0A8H3IH53_9LECA|nr:hypothetical protein IMSHALPRED_004966 [Imshaugia aleurites]